MVLTGVFTPNFGFGLPAPSVLLHTQTVDKTQNAWSNYGPKRGADLKDNSNVYGFVWWWKQVQGVPALIHISELSWNRIVDPTTVVAVGQELEAKVCRLDRFMQRINLSLKQMQVRLWYIHTIAYELMYTVHFFIQIERGLWSGGPIAGNFGVITRLYRHGAGNSGYGSWDWC